MRSSYRALRRRTRFRSSSTLATLLVAFFLSEKLQNVMPVTEPCSGKGCKGRNADEISREMAMEKKLMFVALGYVLLLASLGFALDLSVAAMIVSG